MILNQEDDAIVPKNQSFLIFLTCQDFLVFRAKEAK